MRPLLYIDPQSGDNLAMYDYELLSRLKDIPILYVCSETYNYKQLDSIGQLPIFSYTKRKNSILKGISYCISLIRLKRLIQKERPSLVHVQWFRMPLLEYHFYKFLKRKYDFKLIHTVHNLLPHVNGRNAKDKFLKLYNLSDSLIVHTKTTASNLASQFNISDNKIVVAPHGPLNYIFSSEQLNQEIQAFKKQYNIKAKYIISLLGYQSLYKGTDLAIEAWRSSKKLNDNQEVCFIVAGQNRDFKASPDNKDNNIIILNSRLSDLLFAALMRMSSLILLPYRNIDQSGVLLTIIQEGIPYCTTPVGELTKPFEMGDVGWIIESPSVEAIRKLLEEIIAFPEQLVNKRNNYNAWKKIREYYNWDKAAERTRDLYKKFINRKL